MRAQRGETDPKTWKQTLCEPAQSKRTWRCHKNTRAILCGTLKEKCRTPIPILQEACCVESYKTNAGAQSQESHFVWKITGKFRTQIPRSTFCARLRGRNAHGHFRRTILCRNLQEKCRTPIPRSMFCARLPSGNAHWTSHKNNFLW